MICIYKTAVFVLKGNFYECDTTALNIWLNSWCFIYQLFFKFNTELRRPNWYTDFESPMDTSLKM